MDHRLQLVVAALTALVVAVLAAPAPATPDVADTDEDIVYDQRQNGSENLRINLSDLTIVVAPGDSLSPLVSDAYNMMLLNAALKNKSHSPDCADGGRCKSASRSAHTFTLYYYQYLVEGSHSKVPARQPKLIVRPLTVSWVSQCSCP